MTIQKLEIHNFRGIEHLVFCPDKGLNLFIGQNGAGKSSILDATAIALSWFCARVQNIHANGKPIAEKDIRIGQREASIAIWVGGLAEEDIYWKIYGYTKGPGSRKKSEYEQLNLYLSSMAVYFDRNRTSLPVIAYYQTTRAFVDIPERIRTRHDFTVQTAAYEGCLDVGADFRSFFEWYREQEELENATLRYPDDYAIYNTPHLAEIRQAIESFTNFSRLRIRRKPSIQMVLNKGPLEIDLSKLSDGEQIYVSLVADLARRIAIAQPGGTLAEARGIVLIDEIELHLHPRWQREIIPKLRSTFPDLQFQCTTHSPQVVGEAKAGQTWIVNVQAPEPLTQVNLAYGVNSDLILEALMDASARDPVIIADIKKAYQLIAQRQWVDSNLAIEVLSKKIGDDPEISRLKAALRRQEILSQ